LPEEELHKYTKRSIESRLAMAYGGRVAEELVFGPEKVHDGRGAGHPAGDQHRAPHGHPVRHERGDRSDRRGRPRAGDLPGREVVQRREISDRTAQLVDEEVRSILTHAYSDATRILAERRAALDRLAAALLERETLEREQVEMVVAGQPLPPYSRRHAARRDRAAEREKSPRTTGGVLRNPPPEPAGRDRLSASGRPFKTPDQSRRPPPAVKRALGRVLWLTGAAVFILVALFLVLQRSGAVPVQVVTVSTTSGGKEAVGAGTGGSVAVVANGYVVARTKRLSLRRFRDGWPCSM